MPNILKLPFNENRDHYFGSPIAPVEVIAYADFQCEYSGEIYTSIKWLRQYLGNDLKFVFRHYPLPNVHSLALEAAVAAEAAGLQGKFWDMHDLIFENQRFLVRSSFSRFAEEIELDTTLMEDRLGYKRLVHKVINDFESGVKSGVDGTPTLFINGRRYNGFIDAENLYRTCNYEMNLNSIAFS
jgi:protein-disulfide isomerase